MQQTDFFWDEETFRVTSLIERSIMRLDLDSQGQFIAILNAIDMQLESGDPHPDVVRLLGDALLALAQRRGVNKKNQLHYAERLDKLNRRLTR